VSTRDESSARHERLTELFTRACELEGAARAAFLDAECGGESELRAELESLLAGEALALPLLDGADDPARRGGLVTLLAGADEHWLGCEIGGCKLVELIGVGGMGAVYRAHQENPRRDVAVKLLRGASLGEAGLRRFEAETRLLAHLQHPGIAKVYAAGVHQQGPLRLPYCTLELVEGGRSITSFAEQRNMGVRARITLFLQACDALQHAHERRVIHRDVKPDNLLVDASGRVRVIDFGIARVLADEPGGTALTRTGHLLGTPAYMSPEQVEGRSDELDTRADVYSLGVVLYQLLVGRLPIEVDSASLLEVSRRVLEQEPPRLSTLVASLRGDLDTIVAKALAKDPARRYASAGELAADLRRYLADEPIAARPATAIYQLRKFARRHRGLAAGAVLALASLLIGASVAVWSALQAFDARDRAQRQSYESSLAAAAASVALGDVLAARRRLEAAPPTLRGWEWRRLSAQLDDASLALPGERLNAVAALRLVQFERERDELLSAEVIPDQARERLRVRSFDLDSGAVLRTWTSEPGELLWPAIGRGRVWLFEPARGLTQFDPRDGARLAHLPIAPHVVPPGRVQIESLSAERAFLMHRTSAFQTLADLVRGEWSSPPPLPDAEQSVLIRGSSFDGSGLVSFGREVCFTPFDPQQPRVCVPWASARVTAFAAHPDNQRVYVACQDGVVRVLRLDARGIALEREFEAHVDSILALALSSDGAALATGGRDRTVRVWDAQTHAPLAVLVGAEAAVGGLTFAPDGERLASIDIGGTVRVFDAPRSPDPRVRRVARSHVYALELSHDERWVATGDWDGCVRLWDRESGELLATRELVRGPDARVESLSWSPDGRRLAVLTRGAADVEGVVALDLVSGVALAAQPAQSDGGARALCALDSERFVTVCDRGLELFSFESGSSLGCFAPPSSSPAGALWSLRWRVRLSFDGQRMAAGFANGWVGVYRSSDLALVSAWRAHESSVHDVAWSRDGARLATASADRSARVFEVATGELVCSLEGNASNVFAVAFSHDGERVFTGLEDRTLRVWETRGGRELAQLVGHEDYVFSVECSADDRVLSCSGDGTLRLWDERTRSQLLAVRRERAALVKSLAPRVEREVQDGGCAAAYERLLTASDLGERERSVALQLLVARGFASGEQR
jgi:WD40 repeat protein